jgi:hypothetical protein
MPVRGHTLSVHRAPMHQADWRDALHRFLSRLRTATERFTPRQRWCATASGRGRSLGYDGSTERVTYLGPGCRWYGLSPYPVWWAWFGPLYRPLVSTHLPAEHVITSGAGGLLYEAASEPSDRDELADAPGWLPADLLVRMSGRLPGVQQAALRSVHATRRTARGSPIAHHHHAEGRRSIHLALMVVGAARGRCLSVECVRCNLGLVHRTPGLVLCEIGDFRGCVFTVAMATLQHKPIVMPRNAIGMGNRAALVVGTAADIIPALRAAHTSPTEASRAV